MNPNEILDWWKEQSSWVSWQDCHKQALKDIETLVALLQKTRDEQE